MVRDGGRTILVDAGLGVDPDVNLPRAGRLAQRLEAAGIDLASVTDVVLTHMHFDHIGGLLTDGVKDRLRPDLRIHVSAAEVKFWASPDFSHTPMPAGFPDAIRAAAKRFLNDYQSKLRPFEKEYEVAPGVLVRRTGTSVQSTTSRKVIADTHARYFGTELDDRSLTPGDNARIGSVRFEDWLRDSAVQR